MHTQRPATASDRDGRRSPDFQRTSSLHESLNRLQSAMAAAGVAYTGKSPLRTDGSFNRWDDNGRKGGPLWCVIHELSNGHLAGTFGDWRTASRYEFRSWWDDIPPETTQQYAEELERRRRLAEEAETRNKAHAAKRTAEVWEYLLETGDSEYLKRKQVGAFGIRYGADEHGRFIAVPMRTVAGKFTGFQRIYDDGRKRFPKGIEKKSAYHLIGTIDPAGTLYLAEGYATGATIHEATGNPVVICFDAGNMAAVAAALKSIYPNLLLVVAADNDQWKAEQIGSDGRPIGNTGVRTGYAVAKAHPGTRIAIPQFANVDVSSQPTDFNDLACLTVLENVRRQLEAAKPPRDRGNGHDHGSDPPSQSTAANGEPPAQSPYSLLSPRGGLLSQSLAAAVLAQHNHGLAYDHVAHKWLRYAQDQWQPVTDIVVFRILMGWVEAGLDGHGYNLSFANGVSTFLKALLANDGFDSNPHLVPFRNGVLDLSTGQIIPHSPQLKTTWRLPFDYNPLATCEPVIAWLRESVGGDQLQVELLRAYIKAIITGRADLQRYLELIGAAGSGKGAFIRLCTNLVGACNVHVTELKHLENNRFESARLYRKRLCIITDAEKYTGDVSILKAMTGSDDLRFEEKHRQGGDNFKFQGMLLLAANQEIATSDLTGGLQRRRITVRFDNQVEAADRRDLEAEFEPYLPGVIAWALALDDTRMKELLVETDRHVPTVGRFNMETLKRVNPLAAWADDWLVLDTDAETAVGVKKKVNVSQFLGSRTESRTVIEHTDEWLFANYASWCEGTGNREIAARNFSALLKDLLCHQVKLDGIEKLERTGSKLSRFKGIRLRTEQDQHIPNLLLLRTPKVRQKYAKSTVNGEERTVNTVNSNFGSEAKNIELDSAGLCDTENVVESSFQEKSGFTVRSVLTVPSVEESATYGKFYRTFIVRLPYGDEVRPPDPADDPGYWPGLVAVAPTAADFETDTIGSPPPCTACQNFRPESAGCVYQAGVIPDKANPPCDGQRFEPKRPVTTEEGTETWR